MIRSRFGAALCAALLAVLLPATTLAEDGPDRPSVERIDVRGVNPQLTPALSDPARRVTVMLELRGKPVAVRQGEAAKDGKQLTAAQRAAIRKELKSSQDELAGAIKTAGGRVLGQYQDAYNGVKVRVAARDVAKLAKLNGVVAVHGLQQFRPDNVDGVPFIGAPAAWQDVGATGDGVSIAVIDTGVDYTHANFGGSGDPADFANNDGTVIEAGTFPTAKVVGGYDFVGDDYDASSDDPDLLVPHPDPDPLDCNGHGSHVAGTAAGFGVLSDGSTYDGPYDDSTHDNDFEIGPGVAPEATIYAYRVFGCGGSSDVVIDAIDRAVIDGVDVINMSLGSPFGTAGDPTAVAADNASAAGVVVVTSAGNSGSAAYITGSPGTASSAIATAAVDTIAQFRVASITGGGLDLTAINANDHPLDAPVSGPLRVLSNGSGGVALGCSAADYANVTAGDIVVTLRGVCARVDRAILGEAAGAAAVIMINSSNALPPLEGPIPRPGGVVQIPFLGVPSSATAALTAANGATVTIADAGAAANPGYRALASFTSGGPRSGDSAVKPDVTAPGVSVMSTGVGQGSGGVRISGTSMASPHNAGVAALVRQVNPSWSPAEVKAAIVNTAVADASLLVPAATDPRLAGSGVVQPARAVDTVVRVTGSGGNPNLSFGYEPLVGAYTETIPLTFVNDGPSAATYDLARTFTGSDRGLTLSFAASPVTVPAGGTVTVDVTAALSASAVAALPSAVSAPGSLVSVRGVVTATPTSAAPGVHALRIPFLVAPRGLSNVDDAAPTKYKPVSDGVFERTVTLTNGGIHAGIADVYAWGQRDGEDVGGASMDLRAVGVQTLPGEFAGAPSSDRLLFFAINVHGRWSNASVNEFDIPIDVGRDGTVDYVVVGVDIGALTAGSFNGQLGSFVFDADGNLVAGFNAPATVNGSTLLLPVLASDIGLEAGSSAFDYDTAAFSLEGPAVDFMTAEASFDSHDPAWSQGDFIGLAPGATATLTQTVRVDLHNEAPGLGWLVVTRDDANGAAQAEQIPIGKWRKP